ncbi:TetR/AcrR family transcriptional regulator [Saccharopolyspora griseoalba]|uniref:TetR/AcrR family transcriptional regulator n=1 Tax=Saccharopolyspora griseoalba TaxID=1431848 RepID=A0ABW2LL58_9PSEU
MTHAPRRDRDRAATDQEIRQHARALLVGSGSDAVTLRAIARELGITAPALYRYYDSREALLRRLATDICVDLSDELRVALDPLGQDFLERMFAVCRRFRSWALTHREEFALVFATSRECEGEPDQFGGVFLGVVGPLMAESARGGGLRDQPAVDLPDLSAHREAFAEAFARAGVRLPPGALGDEAAYFLLRWWIRLYGHIALEVFDRFPFDLAYADRLFDTLLEELAQETGLR